MKKFLILWYTINICALEIRVFYGATATPYIESITRIGVGVFRNYPYFEDHTFDEQYYYFDYYCHALSGIACIAFEKGKIVGAVLGCALSDIWDSYKVPFFNELECNLEHYFYIGEMVVEKKYQCKGIGTQLYKKMEQALKEKNIKIVCLAVIDESMRSTVNVKPLSTFWQAQGFEKTGLFFLDFWKVVGNRELKEHKMVFWIKKLI